MASIDTNIADRLPDVPKMTNVDVHTHLYPPSLVELLRSRTKVPYVRSFDAAEGERLIILPSEDASTSTSRGRPFGPDYYDVSRKMSFMKVHGIDISVLSLANPWLDWVAAEYAAETAKMVNDDFETLCASQPGKLYAFATLPLSGTVEEIVAEIARLKTLKYCRGVVMGTSGVGQGLDDLKLEKIWAALEKEEMMLFLHPHYGLPSEVFGPRNAEYGHVLALAMGFPMETTIAVTRMLLSGVFDRFPKLKCLLAHSGGTLPFLAGRIESCIAHDAHLKKEGKLEHRRELWDILRTNIYLDAVIYSELGLNAALDASGGDRIMFGTDHPFFPPLEEDDHDREWPSVTSNLAAMINTFGEDEAGGIDLMGGNALRVLGIECIQSKE
ncbi:unnamed protein product [Zymoseptoria tritici ST99CH_3D7]|uniref:Amidohydrolase-related domain-containing protein n=1 Tax=Zymoseptoria tritici (strain ST99CH_3D7) TaxID=1276538 RepID=A0A1X7RJK1_ZYMT9|nr:unnamed protein product [Zymoseptoria tritici ST99CH_3D7]